MGSSMPEQQATLPVLDADRASWLQDRLRSYSRVVRSLASMQEHMVTADSEMFEQALAGATRGQAREITRLLGFHPDENLEPFGQQAPGLGGAIISKSEGIRNL